MAGLAAFQRVAAAPARSRAQDERTINVLTLGEPGDLALQTVAPQFTEATGIQVNIESLGYTALQACLINAFLVKKTLAQVLGDEK